MKTGEVMRITARETGQQITIISMIVIIKMKMIYKLYTKMKNKTDKIKNKTMSPVIMRDIEKIVAEEEKVTQEAEVDTEAVAEVLLEVGINKGTEKVAETKIRTNFRGILICIYILIVIFIFNFNFFRKVNVAIRVNKMTGLIAKHAFVQFQLTKEELTLGKMGAKIAGVKDARMKTELKKKSIYTYLF